LATHKNFFSVKQMPENEKTMLIAHPSCKSFEFTQRDFLRIQNNEKPEARDTANFVRVLREDNLQNHSINSYQSSSMVLIFNSFCLSFVGLLHFINIWDLSVCPGQTFYRILQGARGIAARFLKWSPASTVSPIMTKFSQYTPHSTCYLVLVSICRQD
jgi:hypothetical protein